MIPPYYAASPARRDQLWRDYGRSRVQDEAQLAHELIQQEPNLTRDQALSLAARWIEQDRAQAKLELNCVWPNPVPKEIVLYDPGLCATITEAASSILEEMLNSMGDDS